MEQILNSIRKTARNIKRYKTMHRNCIPSTQADQDTCSKTARFREKRKKSFDRVGKKEQVFYIRLSLDFQ